MNIDNKGVMFESYHSASPGVFISEFTDYDGATLRINTATLVQMYEICKFDLERRNGWSEVIKNVNKYESTKL